MIRRHRGVDISIDVYYAPPPGWYADQIFDAHKAMRGQFPIDDFTIGKWGAPSWMTQRYEWLRYKATLNRVAAGIRAGDDACIEIGIRFLELRFIGSYSGWIRKTLARALKGASLTNQQADRLNEHFLKIVFEMDYTQEFYEYKKLWPLIATDKTIDRLLSHFRKQTDKSPPDWVEPLVAAYKESLLRRKPRLKTKAGRQRI